MFVFDLVIGFVCYFSFIASSTGRCLAGERVDGVLSELFTGSEENAFFPGKLAAFHESCIMQPYIMQRIFSSPPMLHSFANSEPDNEESNDDEE